MSALAPALGFFRLRVRLHRQFLAMNLFSGFGLPLIVQAAFGQQLPPEARTRLLVGNAILGVAMVVMREVSLSLVVERVLGYRDLVATTALDRRGYLLAYAGNSALLAVLPLLFLLVGPWLPGVAPPLSFRWLLPYALVAASFAALGMLLGARAESVPAVSLRANLAVLVTIAFCPVSYPVERVPDVLRPLVTLLPASLGAELLEDGWAGAPILDGRLLALGLWTLALGVLGWRRVSWTDSVHRRQNA